MYALVPAFSFFDRPAGGSARCAEDCRGAHTPRVGHGHDIIAIGASAGGVQALQELVAGLPPDLPAAVFVALHTAPGHPSHLPQLLARCGALRAAHGVHGEEIVPGRIYVAPPDNHLVVRAGVLEMVRGPKENGFRPSVDTLFRSASAAYGPASSAWC